MQLLLLKVYANEISGEACDPRNRAVNPYFELLNPGNIQNKQETSKKWMIPAIKFMGKDLNAMLIS
jgi:hypothetical protein